MSWPQACATATVLPAGSSRHAARIIEAGILPDRQRIHVGAQHDGRSLAVAQQADDAGLADAGRHLIAVTGQMLRGDLRRAAFLHRQFRMGMDVLINGLQRRQ